MVRLALNFNPKPCLTFSVDNSLSCFISRFCIQARFGVFFRYKWLLHNVLLSWDFHVKMWGKWTSFESHRSSVSVSVDHLPSVASIHSRRIRLLQMPVGHSGIRQIEHVFWPIESIHTYNLCQKSVNERAYWLIWYFRLSCKQKSQKKALSEYGRLTKNTSSRKSKDIGSSAF